MTGARLWFRLPGAGTPARLRAMPLLAVPLLAGGLVDVPRLVTLGPLTGLGLVSIALLAIVAVGLLACRRFPVGLLRACAPYAVFLVWAALRSVTAVPDMAGAQNALVYAVFGGQILLAGTLAWRSPVAVADHIDRVIRIVDLLALGLVLLSLARADGRVGDEDWIVGPRGLALAALVPVAWHLASWQHGRGGGWRAVGWSVVVLLSLSRTAMAVVGLLAAATLLLQARTQPGALVRRLPLVAAGLLLVGGAAWRTSEALDARFGETYNRVQIAGVSVGTSGRNHMWPLVIDEAAERPFVGHGLGTSQAVVHTLGDTVAQPHNDYLRLWHDLGLTGAACFVVAVLAWLRRLWAGAVGSARTGTAEGTAVLAAALSLTGVALAAITDNAVIYAFVMAPLGVVVGAGLALALRGKVLQGETTDA